MPYYLRFEEEYPTVGALAQAEIEQILKLWQGLGYYSRAHNLHRCAKVVVDRWAGKFPKSKAELLTLPGIGDYTASAVASIAFGEKAVVLDGNVFRVLSRHFGIEEATDSPAGRKVFRQTAEELLGSADPAEFNQALMEFGALQCTPKSPECARCPFSQSCVARDQNRISSLPVKKGKVKVKAAFLEYYLTLAEGKMAMVQRDHSDIWKGLYEMPSQTFDQKVDMPWKEDAQLNKTLGRASDYVHLSTLSHQLTHRAITASFHLVNLKTSRDLEWPGLIWCDNKLLQDLAVPRLIDKFLKTPEGRSVLSQID